MATSQTPEPTPEPAINDSVNSAVVDDAPDNTSDYVVVDGVLTLRRDVEERARQTEGVTVVPAEATTTEETTTNG